MSLEMNNKRHRGSMNAPLRSSELEMSIQKVIVGGNGSSSKLFTTFSSTLKF